MNLNLTALTTSLALSLSLSAPLLAQYPPSYPSGATPQPSVPVPGDPRSRQNVPYPTDSRSIPGGAYGGPQAYIFQGTSKSLNYQDALSDALNKARKSSNVDRDASLNFRVLEVRGTTEGQQQKNGQLVVTIQVFSSGDPASSDARQRSNFPSGQNPNFPPNQGGSNFPSGQNPNFPPNQGGYYPQSVPPSYPQP